jgi:hypothetical protein
MKVNSFIYIAILAYMITVSYAREAEAATEDFTPYIELGRLFNESDASMGSIGVTYKNKWQLNRTFIGAGETEYGPHPKAKVWSVDRLITPGWMNSHFFMVLGVAKIDTSFLVEPYNYHVGFGWQWPTGKLYFHHLSSGDINDQNTGINLLTWRVDL